VSTNAATVDARRYRIRHVYPDAAGTVTFLGRAYGGKFLPTSFAKDSSDFVEGSWTRRMGDAGEWELQFPNVAASDDRLWRERFSPDGALQWVEIYRELDLEFVGVIERVEIDRGMVKISGSDGMALLKRAYERDRLWRAAPHEVIHHYTRVPQVRLVEDFDGVGGVGAPAGWTTAETGGVTPAWGAGLLTWTNPGAAGDGDAYIDLGAVSGDSWRMVATFPITPATGGGNWSVELVAYDSSTGFDDFIRVLYHSTRTAHVYTLQDSTTYEALAGGGGVLADTPLTLMLEGQGAKVRGYVNGELVGYVGGWVKPDTLRVGVNNLSTGERVSVDQVSFVELVPFLQGSTPEGLTRSAGDLPWSGLRGRYFNDADLQGLTGPAYASALHTAEREPYAERLDPVLNTGGGLSLPMQPGAATNGFWTSEIWTGSIYLNPGPTGVVSLPFTNGTGGFWIKIGGDEGLAAEIDYTLGTSGGSGAVTVTDGAGWYPIVIRRSDGASTPAFNVQINITGTGTYVDPGGTTITRGVNQQIPATSLSPLGVFEERVQGQSHFDVVTQCAKEFGLELLLEPRSLESGQFPGRLVPVARVGRDTDMVLTVEEDERGTPILSPGATIDASEQTVQLIGNAQGLGGGSRGTVTAEVIDAAGAAGSLFMLQTWLDAGDIGFPELLAARLGAELGLRATPWQEVRGNPFAQDRLADSFPLSGALAAFRWIPGDGIRVRVPEVGVDDVEPRRIVQLTRSFGVNGRTGAQVAFRNRPRGAAVALGALARASLKRGRTKAPQLVTVDGETTVESILAGSAGAYGRIFLNPNDRISRAYLRIPILTVPSLGVEINGTMRTTELGGPWAGGPLSIDVTAYAFKAGASDGRLFFRLHNLGGSAGSVEWQPTAEVLR